MKNQQENIPNFGVIIPTYNNEKTLRSVIEQVLYEVAPSKIILVNDGSTDSTSSILTDFPEIHQLHFPKNKGKGMALRSGFKKAKSLGFTHVITIDSDGQHFPEEIPIFIKASQESPDTLFIGARNMNQEDVPSKSSFGNKFSNFWFWFETGIKLTDTQSGFRLYPLKKFPKKWYSKKFEFEIECIVRAAWNGIPVKNIPIRIQYNDKDRVSHFRPFTDFTRISIVNTVLVFLLFCYIIPRNFFRKFKKKSLHNFIFEDVLGSNDSPKIKAFSLALGVFIGIIPIWGFQTAVVLFLAIAFRLNKVLAFAASNISIPPMIPIIVITALQIGGFLLNIEITTENMTTFAVIKHQLYAYIFGSLILALAASIFVGLSSYIILKRLEKRKN